MPSGILLTGMDLANGIWDINGIYVYNGAFNGRTKYTLFNAPNIGDPEGGPENFSIQWDADNLWWIGIRDSSSDAYFYNEGENVAPAWGSSSWSAYDLGTGTPVVAQSPVTTERHVIVSEAIDYPEVNGIYTYRGMYGGKPYYNLIGAPHDPANKSIQWADDSWYIIISNGNNVYYFSQGPNTGTAYPWQKYSGIYDWEDVKVTELLTFGLPVEIAALITTRHGSVANFLRLRNQGQV